MQVKACLYARVSTEDQNAAMQLEDLRLACAARHWDIVKEYVDTGVSGSKRSRPELDRMLSDVRVGRIDAVLVWRFDRMARGALHLLEVVELFNTHNVQFVSLKESIDTGTATGRFFVTMIGAIADLERDTLRTRVRAGILHAQKHGTKTGRPHGRPKAFFDRKVAEEMKAAGVSTHGIAKSLGISQSTVYKELILRK